MFHPYIDKRDRWGWTAGIMHTGHSSCEACAWEWNTELYAGTHGSVDVSGQGDDPCLQRSDPALGQREGAQKMLQ